jgi:hypothetical protein
MPYCEDCAKYWTPSAMNDDGTCPTCGRTVEAPVVQSTITAKNLDLKKLAAGDGEVDDVGAPWHFKLLVVLLAVYLGWRFVQLLT